MTLRRALIASAIVTATLFVVLGILDLRMQDTGGPGILGFEYAGSEDSAAKILADWGDKGQDAARASLWLDYLYLISYAVFLTLAVAAVRDLAEQRGLRRIAVIGVAVIAFPASGAAFDAIEDVGLLLALDGHGGDAAPRLAAICASFKFVLITASIVYLLAGLLGAWRRGPSPSAS
jgi:hypothetical protein